ncbi:MAG: hypothetical protein GY716_00455 [bacterium]|nr:hypothetical protein [bacterium]
MNRTQWIALGGLALLATLILVLALRNRQPPPLPQDPAHSGGVSAEQCMACHSAGGVAPRTENHPVGNDCSRCHGG